MRILLLGKRRYTNKDAFRERFGRIFQLPLHWHSGGLTVEVTLLDYRRSMFGTEHSVVDGLDVRSIPALDPRTPFRLRAQQIALQPDVVVASGDCFVGLIAWWLARQSNSRFVFDVYDDYRTFGAYRAFMGWDAFGYLIRHASVTWFANSALALAQAHEGKSAIVPNGVDPDEFRPSNQSAARATAGLAADATWVGYFGSMEPDRGTDDLVAAVGFLHARDPSIRLVLCGGAPDRRRYVASWLDDRGNIPHKDVSAFINACDVVVLPYRRGAVIDKVSSLKMGEYLFCRRPIVATRTPSLIENFPLQASELGPAIAEPGNPADLARAIEHQLLHPRLASVPNQQTWGEIAKRALQSINT